MAKHTTSLVIHGGAGPDASRDYQKEVEHLRDVAAEGAVQLREGRTALDIAQHLVSVLEDSGLYAAGRGSGPNLEGVYEVDASIMDGASRRAGAVAALVGFESAVDVARAVMERTPHVMLAGLGAARFAAMEGFATIPDPHAYFTSTAPDEPPEPGTLAHGTVGAVVRDAEGRLAAATSTGGVFYKLPGRVGDTPLIAAGTWADERVAVSCTGQGEYFIRAAAAADVAARMTYGGQSLAKAAAGAVADMAKQGGEGGLIAVDRKGRIAMPFNAPVLKRAWLDRRGEPQAAAT